MLSTNDAVSSYLQQIQPRDLPDLLTHVHHDLSMLLGSFTAYFELLEAQLNTIRFSDDLAQSYKSGLRMAIDSMRSIFDNYLQPDKLPSGDAYLLRDWQAILTHDLRAPISLFMGWTSLLQYELNEVPSSPIGERAKHLNSSMQVTTDRMALISQACLHTFQPAEAE